MSNDSTRVPGTPDSAADRNLLFGILALQNNFIDRDALLAAFAVWVVDKRRPIGEILCQQGKLTQLQDELLRALTEQHIQQHGNDPEQSLAAVSSVGSLHTELRKLGDPQLEASLAAVVQEAQTVGRCSPRMASTRDWGGEGPRFRVLRPHAKGGLGEVFVAQDLELHREVALKEIQAQFADQSESRSRFVLEAEITGGLEHPGIVPVYGLGQYADGRPFYAMRFIRGDSLAEAIELFHQTRLTATQRGARGKPATDALPVESRLNEAERNLEFRKLLGRFIDVCEAMEYAHSRGILHRDLKPGNIMLGKYGETLVVDWGLAKPVGRAEQAPETGEHTLRPSSGDSVNPTIMGQAIGTPAYMSPEQAAGRLDELGPASDVYSLGATLYSLLVGQAPFAGNDQGEILKYVERGEFRRPREVRPQAPVPLQAICLKAMALNPTDRYQSPKLLVEDLEHWLADEPVKCYREPPLVRARRWIRRHPTLVVGTAATVLISLVSLAAIAAIVGQSNRSLAAKNLELDAKNLQLDQTNTQLAKSNTDLEVANVSERAAKQDADQKRLAADKARDETKQVLDYLVAAFRKSDPDADGETLTVAALFGPAAEEMETTFPNQPIIQAELLNAIGQTYSGLGLHQKAIAVHERARDLRRNELSEDHEATLTSMNNLAAAYRSAGRLEEAVLLHEQTLNRRQATLGPEHPDTLTSMNHLALAYKSAGRLAEVLPLLEKALELRTAKLGPEHSDTLTSMNNLARAYEDAGKFAQALPLFEKTLALMQVQLGQEHPKTLTVMGNLASSYRFAGRMAESLQLHERTFELRKAKLGPEHPHTLLAMNELAYAYRIAKRLSEAVPLFEQTLELRKTKLGPEHPDTLTSMNNLARAYEDAGRLAEAVPLYEKTLELRKAKLGPEHPSTAISMNNLAVAYKSSGRLAEALPLYEQALALRKAQLGPDHPGTLAMMSNLALAYLVGEQPEKALPLYAQLIAGHRKRATPDDPTFAGQLFEVSLDLLQYRQYPAAETYLRECLTIQEKKLPHDWALFDTKSMLGGALVGQKKFQEAEPLLVDGYSGMKEREAKIPPAAKTRLPEAIRRLVDLYTVWDKPDQAAEWQKKLDELTPAKVQGEEKK